MTGEEALVGSNTPAMSSVINSSSGLDELGHIVIDRANFGPPDIASSELTYLGQIGRGKFGSVYEGRCRGFKVAIKKLHKQSLSEKALNEFRREVELCSRLNHPNVVLFMGACTEPKKMAIVTEFCDRGNLQTLLYDTNTSLSLYRKMIMAKDVAVGMSWLHGANPQIVHRDVKPSNLLVDKYGCVKVCDFGLSTLKETEETMKDVKSSAGSPTWCAPEVFKCSELTEKVDIYAFGIVLWEIITQETPFPNIRNYMQLRRAITVSQVRPTLDNIEDENLKKLLTMCWAEQASSRPSFPDILSALNSVLEDCCIRDVVGNRFWKQSFHNTEQILFPDFISQLVAQLAIPTPTKQEIECMDSLLAKPFYDGIMRPDRVVNIEDFGFFLRTFGPIIVGNTRKQTIFQRVRDVCCHGWFFGILTKEEISLCFRGQQPGNYIVRISSRDPDCFTLTYMGSDHALRHQRILNRGVDGFIAVNTSRRPLASIGSSFFLHEVVKELCTIKELTNPVPNSPFIPIFSERFHSDERDSYTIDLEVAYKED